MDEVEKRNVTDEENQRVAVQLDIETFERLEAIVEDYGLAKLMEENDEENETFGLSEAKTYYTGVKRSTVGWRSVWLKPSRPCLPAKLFVKQHQRPAISFWRTPLA